MGVCYNTKQCRVRISAIIVASQASEAGSIPVPCSKKKDHPPGGLSFWKSAGGNRTHLNATPRWGVAREGWAERLQSVIDSRTLLTTRWVVFLFAGEAVLDFLQRNNYNSGR